MIAKGGKLDDNFTQGFVKGDIIVNDSNSRYVVVTNKGKVYIVGDNGQRGQQMQGGKVKPTKAGDLSLKDVRKYQQELEKQFFAKGGQIDGFTMSMVKSSGDVMDLLKC